MSKYYSSYKLHGDHSLCDVVTIITPINSDGIEAPNPRVVTIMRENNGRIINNETNKDQIVYSYYVSDNLDDLRITYSTIGNKVKNIVVVRSGCKVIMTNDGANNYLCSNTNATSLIAGRLGKMLYSEITSDNKISFLFDQLDNNIQYCAPDSIFENGMSF